MKSKENQLQISQRLIQVQQAKQLSEKRVNQLKCYFQKDLWAQLYSGLQEYQHILNFLLRNDQQQIMSVVRRSASLVLIRDDFKVLMLKRNQDISFGNSYAFPGGVIDESDYAESKKAKNLIQQHSQYFCQKTQDWYCAAIIAAIRETYEETNINLHDVNILPFIRLITPQSMKKRYDTQFFLLNLNHYNDLNINTDESSAYEWNTPSGFLEKCIQNQISLFPPIFLQLFILKQLGSIPNIYKYIQSGNPLKHTFPNIFQFTKGYIRNYPDQGYDVQKLIEQEQTQYLVTEFKEKFTRQDKTDFRFEFNGNLDNFKGIIGTFRDSPLALLDGVQVLNKQLVQNQAKL